MKKDALKILLEKLENVLDMEEEIAVMNQSVKQERREKLENV
jgi:hypothetical protein